MKYALCPELIIQSFESAGCARFCRSVAVATMIGRTVRSVNYGAPFKFAR